MPTVFRSMKAAADGFPIVGDQAKELGVRVPPNPHADIDGFDFEFGSLEWERDVSGGKLASAGTALDPGAIVGGRPEGKGVRKPTVLSFGRWCLRIRFRGRWPGVGSEVGIDHDWEHRAHYKCHSGGISKRSRNYENALGGG